MANTIQLKRGTGSAVPSQGSLAVGELAINIDSGKLYYGSGSSVLSDFRFDKITAETYVISSSVTHMTTSFSSGSTAFGDSAGDTHTFTGHVTASGDISSSTNIYAADYFDNGANINTIYAPIASPSFTGNITASGNISASGTIKGSSLIGPLATAAQTNITQVGTLAALEIDGTLTMNGDNIGMNGGEIEGALAIYVSSVRGQADGDIDMRSDGNITFVLDDDADETDQKFIFQNNNTEIATLNESGDLQLDGEITASGHVSSSANVYAADYFDDGANINTLYSPIAGGSGIVTVGTIGTGTWSGDVIAEAKLQNQSGTNTGDETTATVNALDITEVGALADGTIASGFGNIDNGTSTLDTGNATVARLICTADATFGGGYGSTGATISTAGVGTFNGALTTDAGLTCTGTVLIGGGTTVGGRILIREATNNGTHYIGFQSPPALTANTGFMLPDGDGSANQVIKTDGSGTLAWTDMSGGTVGWHGSGTRIKILASDFIGDDGGRPQMIDDTDQANENFFIESYASNTLYVTMAIPTGYTATHVMIYGSATDAVEVWEHQINSKTGVSKGTGNVDTEINITDVASSTTNYLFIQVANAAGNEVHGGYITIAES
jgi:hypothetical protein